MKTKDRKWRMKEKAHTRDLEKGTGDTAQPCQEETKKK
jgi:hypothetical protein